MSVNNRVLVGIRPVEQPSFTTYSYDVEDHFTTDQVLIPSLNDLYVEVSGIPVYFDDGSVVRAYTNCTLYDINGDPWTIENVEYSSGYRLRSTYHGQFQYDNTTFYSPVSFGFTLHGGAATYDTNSGFFKFTVLVWRGAIVLASSWPRTICKADEKYMPATVRREYKLTESKG